MRFRLLQTTSGGSATATAKEEGQTGRAIGVVVGVPESLHRSSVGDFCTWLLELGYDSQAMNSGLRPNAASPSSTTSSLWLDGFALLPEDTVEAVLRDDDRLELRTEFARRRSSGNNMAAAASKAADVQERSEAATAATEVRSRKRCRSSCSSDLISGDDPNEIGSQELGGWPQRVALWMQEHKRLLRQLP
eukprot:TRINITY_DN34100_c0_g1_i3.p1 TRINITY_DN34100_c0_g1~~TRINITY_DN34100_c0_g1_i3.p1  ORF type:complete len:211 (+),score=47.89 TRINITY_DN34100_c0_g1_i3:63-635(+)